MKLSAKVEVQLLLDACLKTGITHVVLSPGSRNAPLSISFDEHPEFTTYVVPDERAAAFYALGMAQQLNRPVAIACTSGSAPLNYFPAVAEAYYQGIPLIVLTADRPDAWVDQGDGQTIVQRNVYGSHVLASTQLHTVHTDEDRWHLERKLTQTLQAAVGRQKGPVHLNIPFSEPLYEVSEDIQRLTKWVHFSRPEETIGMEEENELRSHWMGSSKRLILCGQMEKNPRLEKALAELSADSSVLVLVEHTSNLQHERFVHCTDRTLNQFAEDLSESVAPDLIVTFGGAVVSKRIKTFLRRFEASVIRVSADFPAMDTYRSLVYSTAVDPGYFGELLVKLNKHRTAPSIFGASWKNADMKAAEQHQLFLDDCPFSDLKVMEQVLASIPENTQLHLGNSSVIRYALLFDPAKTVRYRCNRGTSGIDGSSSTACGAALADPDNWHVLICGDLSFFYDSNAFWNNELPSNLRVIVINNGGGDIFNIIPGPDTIAQREKYFVASQQFSAEHICRAFNLGYMSADTSLSLDVQLELFYNFEKGGRPIVMEIQTAGLGNAELLKRYFRETARKG